MNEAKGLKKYLAVLGAFALLGLSMLCARTLSSSMGTGQWSNNCCNSADNARPFCETCSPVL